MARMPVFRTILLLILSNVFMTLAWYAHLGSRNRPESSILAFIADLHNRPWFLAVLVSWGIAFVEYVFQVPANRIGAETLSRGQLKILQEVISLVVFALLAFVYWREPPGWNYLAACVCILAAVFFVFRDPAKPIERDERPAIQATE
jgi:uncharacterized protein (DUF486 family)